MCEKNLKYFPRQNHSNKLVRAAGSYRTWISKKLLNTMKKNSKLILVARTWREKSNAEVYLPISKKKIYQA